MAQSPLLQSATAKGVWLALLAPFMAVTMYVTGIGDAQAIPAFARKYDANCALCHTNEPRLKPFGQQFKENGYQMPGTADGGTTAKDKLDSGQGPVTLDDVSNYFAARIRADVQQASFDTEKDDMKSDGVREELEIKVPKIINVFISGTAMKNLSFFTEMEYNTEEHDGEASVGFERAFLIFDNLGGQSLANVKVGKFDPSGLFAFPTHRQQMNPIFPKADTEDFPPTINRIPMVPLAFSSKMFGLTKGQAYAGSEGHAILPFAPSLFNAPSQTAVEVFGRPLGFDSPFMYQLGMATNDKVTGSTDKERRYDFYAMGRYDWRMGGADMQASAFYYKAPDAAVSTLKMGGNEVYANQPTDIDSWGVGVRGQWGSLSDMGEFDVYAAFVQNSIDDPTFAMAAANTSTWDETGSGLSAEADWRFHPEWMFGMRYDWMSPGGLSKLPTGADPAQTKLNVDTHFLATILKYYPHPNIGLYGRLHYNLSGSKDLPNGGPFDGSEHPATNLEYYATVGVDMAF